MQKILLSLLVVVIITISSAYAMSINPPDNPWPGNPWEVPIIVFEPPENPPPLDDPPVTIDWPPKPVLPPTPPAPPVDKDPNEKGGGKDPFVIRENWGYIEFNAHNCSNAPNSFDYDNDGFPEHMCYWYTPETRIFFNDRYDGKLVNGLNFVGDFTHLWQDKNSNVFVDQGELTSIEDAEIKMLQNYPDGIKDLNDRYIYCVGESDHGDFACTQPTYWMTQEWMK